MKLISVAFLALLPLVGCQTHDKEIMASLEKHKEAMCACTTRDCGFAAFDKLIAYGKSLEGKRVKDEGAVIRAAQTSMEAAGECLGELIASEEHKLKSFEAIGLPKPASVADFGSGIKNIVDAMCECSDWHCFAGQADRLGGYVDLTDAEFVDGSSLAEVQRMEGCLQQALRAGE